jgi:3'-phosphoadenosine 5'-phosphosulfate synthase
VLFAVAVRFAEEAARRPLLGAACFVEAGEYSGRLLEIVLLRFTREKASDSRCVRGVCLGWCAVFDWTLPSLSFDAAADVQDEHELPHTQPRRRGYDNDDSFRKRRDMLIGFLVLMAIVYVLARAAHVNDDPVVVQSSADFNIDKYRAERLAASQPHIIECAEADAGGSQQVCHLPRQKRYAAIGHKGVTLWMTGLSGSGKSTIAKAIEEELVLRHGKHVYRLDGDNIRTALNRDLGFSKGDRAESVRRVGELSCLFSDAGVITIVSLVSPYREDRDQVRKRHEEQGIPFMELFMDVPLEVVQQRDPKGLYKKVAAGEIKGFTGVDDPYEPPLHAEIVLPNYKMTVEECVAVVIKKLRQAGVLTGGVTDPSGLPMPDGGEIIDLYVRESERKAKMKEAETLPKALLTDIDLNWLQTIAEGWAAPLRGFMREGVLLQTLHFNSILIDPYDVRGMKNAITSKTDFNKFDSHPPERVSMSVPIVLPATDFTKREIESSGKNAVALVTKHGKTIAILRNPEIYENRKEEIVTRMFGVIDPGHPYIKHIYSGGNWLIGGELEVLERIRFNDGLDQYRLTASELYAEFKRRGSDAVFAFQTRNPTHAGHAYLMRTAREKLIARGYKNPVLWLSPLGGWTKSDDVPLDVRVKQHEAVLKEKMLDPETTVLAIWPAPMVYGGPTEVQFHAKSRRNGGASFFVVGRDPAGMKGSELAWAHPDDDLYHGDHGRYVLQMSPGLRDMEILNFDKVYYDKKTNTMTAKDESRPDDFISISGSKMRALARNGATPCGNPIPSDLEAANCVPKGFMVPSGWEIVCDYYQNVDSDRWVPYSVQVVTPETAPHTTSTGKYGTGQYALHLTGSGGAKISPWHDISLKSKDGYNMITEIPMHTTAKMEVQKDEPHNPIMQDTNDDGSARYYTYGVPFFNYGLFPQTWEDPDLVENGHGGDNDPLDVIEVGSTPLLMGSVTSVKVLGSLELIDGGETDHKIIVLRTSDPLSPKVNSVRDLEHYKPGTCFLLLRFEYLRGFVA